MKKTVLILGILIIVAAAALVYVRFVIGGDEDTWICDSGRWVKHGNPTAAAPTTPCR